MHVHVRWIVEKDVSTVTIQFASARINMETRTGICVSKKMALIWENVFMAAMGTITAKKIVFTDSK